VNIPLIDAQKTGDLNGLHYKTVVSVNSFLFFALQSGDDVPEKKEISESACRE
jgi:hypothetical protein